jgi:inorganic pyrophosphatase
MMQEPVVPMCFMRVRPIGVMHMIDGGEADDKIIAVHLDDPEYKHIKDISEVPKHRLAEIRCADQCLHSLLSGTFIIEVPPPTTHKDVMLGHLHLPAADCNAVCTSKCIN